MSDHFVFSKEFVFGLCIVSLVYYLLTNVCVRINIPIVVLIQKRVVSMFFLDRYVMMTNHYFITL